ncbi:permease [Nocardioides carbamazepini]|uniref:permease n=1 Tax=Nocardioides carbamazepini TaxID=2854259 RepID=UPI00214A55A2|nr:permease [Nocardioides carbamazepini]MCR1784011.1 permease [Nocardioides carbamazepini]
MTAQQVAEPPGETARRSRGARPAWVPLVVVLTLVAVLRAVDVPAVGWLNNFLLVYVGLLVEAVPFVLLGAAAAAAIEVYVSPEAFGRLARAPRPVQVAVASCGGLVLPVCECGSVPVARRLLLRGLTPAAAITFMLAAPIVNPVVILSTWFAFRGRTSEGLMVGGRVALGLTIAVVTGLVMARALQRSPVAGIRDAVGHEHEHGATGNRPRLFAEHTGAEFLGMMKYMLIGAGVAAALQTFIPQRSIDTVAGATLLAIPAMMAFAFVLSLCSESDALFIASFVQFSPAAQLAFLAFGPMADTKLSAMYVGALGPAHARRLIVTVTVTTLVLCLWLQAALVVL